MALKQWCGKDCSECKNSCSIDENIPCSPFCENLTERGTIKIKQCLKSNCEEIKYIFDMVDASDQEVIDKYGEEAIYPFSFN